MGEVDFVMFRVKFLLPSFFCHRTRLNRMKASLYMVKGQYWVDYLALYLENSGEIGVQVAETWHLWAFAVA